MRIALLLTIFFEICSFHLFAQDWNDDQKQLADVARDISYLSDVEKDAIQYINLCRMYPKDFAEYVVKGYEMDSLYGIEVLQSFTEFKQSLLNQLQTQNQAEPLLFNDTLFQDAKCYAVEISTNARKGHERKNCPKIRYAECVSFGMDTGKEIALQWLFDRGVSSLGHRMICLDPKYKKIAIKAEPHFQYGHCAVAEFQ